VTETHGGQPAKRAGLVHGQGSVKDEFELRAAQLQVLSQAFANIAHDVQNHLAAINESAGWMEDLLRLKHKKRFGWIRRFFKAGKEPGQDIRPLLDILQTIQGQVAEGSTLNQRFSSFAHRQGETWSVFSASKALEEIQDVLCGDAREKGVHLEIELASAAAMIETDPPGFQLAAFSCVEQVTESLANGDRMTLETEARQDQFHICLTSPLLSGEPGGEDFPGHLTEQLGGQLWKQSGDGKHVTTLAFPLARGET
jgi:signal transduction histidine kinase